MTGGGAGRVELFDGLRGEDGIAFVVDVVVFDAELFGEPDDALGL